MVNSNYLYDILMKLWNRSVFPRDERRFMVTRYLSMAFTRADEDGAWKVMVRRSDDHLTADCGLLLVAAINF